jgi:NADH-quinone oxidoreductase subunit H
VAEINIGILFAFGIISIGVYGIMIGGWASNNKYSLFGAIRASSQMISYELAMGISAITIIMISGSLDLRAIVESQHGMNWNIFYQPVAFVVFFICALAETNRAPFDLPECENELIGGYHTEYSSMKLGLFLFSEYVAMFVSSALMAILFFGGYNFPGMDYLKDSPNLLALISVMVFFAKIFVFIFVFMWIRWTIPRFRFDQLMHLGWKVLIPIALVNMLITGFVVALYEHWF